MKKRNNGVNLTSVIKNTLLLTLIILGIIASTNTISSWLFHLFESLNFTRDFNSMTLWFMNYAIVSTCIGGAISLVVFPHPMMKMQSLIDAMEKISDGDFSVRIKRKSKLKIFRKAINMFNKMAQQLSATETLSHDFINNFSHEFKSPITSISGFAKLLKNNDLTEEEKNEYLDIIIQESERLSNLSTSILELSRLEQQTILTDKTLFNVTEQIRITVGSLYPRLAEKNIHVNFHAEETEIFANKNMLQQVWLNLLDNAIKFSPEGEEIEVEIVNSSEDEFIQFFFSNKGKTVHDENAIRVFDRFYQGDISHSTKGNGLGLAMVKRIVELHGGEIWLKEEVEDITVFSITLPKELQDTDK